MKSFILAAHLLISSSFAHLSYDLFLTPSQLDEMRQNQSDLHIIYAIEDISTPSCQGAPDGMIPNTKVISLNGLRAVSALGGPSLPAPMQFEKLMNKLGIGQSGVVVIYDSGECPEQSHPSWLTAYVYFMFKVYSRRDVKVMPAGLTAWVKGNHTLGPQYPYNDSRRTDFAALFDRQVILTWRDVYNMNMKKSDTWYLVDARSEAEFNGSEPQSQNSGYIKGAINIPVDSMFNSTTGDMYSAADIKAELIKRGIAKGHHRQHLTLYSRKGRRAALLGLALSFAWPRLRWDVYVGGWHEWQMTPVFRRMRVLHDYWENAVSGQLHKCPANRMKSCPIE